MNPVELLCDLHSRIIRAEEALEDGDSFLAFELLRDLEADLIGILGRLAA